MTEHVKKTSGWAGSHFWKESCKTSQKVPLCKMAVYYLLFTDVSKTAMDFATANHSLSWSPWALVQQGQEWDVQNEPHNSSMRQTVSGREQYCRTQLVSSSELGLTIHALKSERGFPVSESRTDFWASSTQLIFGFTT